MMIKNILRLLTIPVYGLVLLSCSSDNEPVTDVPPQTTESESVSIALNLGTLTRAIGAGDIEGDVKIQWEEGDKVYFNYIKTFAADEEILNDFTLTRIDEFDSASAVFTCPDFIVPRGVKEGNLVFVGDRNVVRLADLQPETIDLSVQKQIVNNSLKGIGNYLHMATSYFQIDSPGEISQIALLMKHSYSLMSLQIKRPEGWIGELTEVVLQLNSDNVTLLGTTDNRMVLTLGNGDWDSDRLIVYFILNLSGLINSGNTWTVSLKDSSSEDKFIITYPAKQLEKGTHYTWVVSDDPSDYETPVHITVPGFEDGGDAF